MIRLGTYSILLEIPPPQIKMIKEEERKKTKETYLAAEIVGGKQRGKTKDGARIHIRETGRKAASLLSRAEWKSPIPNQ
jgi:hypothetical protein